MDTSRTQRPGAARRLVVALAGLALATGGLVATPAPAGAAPADSDTLVFVPFRGQTFGVARNGTTTYPSYTTGDFRGAEPFTGDFTGSAGADVFWYRPGRAPDGIVRVTPSGTGVTTTFIPKTVNGIYQPLVGDFDGNAIDDIIWYAPGSSPDSLWLFDSSGGHTSVPLTVNGDYVPTVIEADGDGDDDVVWYRAGTGADSIWLFGAGATHTSKPITINGSYLLVPGHFGDRPEGSPQERLVFFNAAGPDSIWTFDTAGNHTAAALPDVDGAFTPVVGRFTGTARDAILWYRPGSGSERFWSFTAGGAVDQLEPPTVNGTYDPVVLDQDGNGYQDIAWTASGNATVWRFTSGGYSQTTVSTGLPNTTALAAFTDPADL
ncbi:MAG TPA: hypothetical protein VFU19_05855 [Iamia sp.]|nr:hypothetical protein [Iamia sp.]